MGVSPQGSVVEPYTGYNSRDVRVSTAPSAPVCNTVAKSSAIERPVVSRELVGFRTTHQNNNAVTKNDAC